MKKRAFVALGTVLALAAGYLYCIAPNTTRREEMRPFEQVLIAHRGLFDNETDAPENSLPAFRRAVEAGYGVELDVQMTTDGTLMVFHDDSLLRLCGEDRLLTACKRAELDHCTLLDTAEHIPTLDEALEVIGGRVPLVVEIKSAGDWKATAQALAERMDRYEGVWCVQSFHPLAVAWFRDNRPEVLRGQLADDFFRTEESLSVVNKVLLSNLLLNFRAKPDFISYNFRHADQPTYRLCTALYPVERLAWTLRGAEELEQARPDFDGFIFDSFTP